MPDSSKKTKPYAEGDTKQKERTAKKPNHLKRWLLIIGILLAIFIPLINGPGARYVVEKALSNTLKTQRMSGSAQIDGTLSSGLTLTDARYTGENAIKTLSFDTLSIKYTLGSLIKKELDLVKATNLTVSLDPSLFPQSSKKDTATLKPLPELLRSYQKLFLPVKVDMTDIKISLSNKNGAAPSEISFKNLLHESGSDVITLKDFQAKNIAGFDTPIQNNTITWTQEGLQLDRFTPLSKVSVSDVKLGTPTDNKIAANGIINLPNAKLILDSPSPTDISITLSDGPINLKELSQVIGKPDLLTGNLDAVDIKLANLDKPLDSITGTVSIDLSQVGKGFTKLKYLGLRGALTGFVLDTEIKLTKDDHSSQLNLTLPIEGLESFEDLSPLMGKDAIIEMTTTLNNYPIENGETLSAQINLEGVVKFDPSHPHFLSSAIAQHTIGDINLSKKPLPDITGTASLSEGNLLVTLATDTFNIVADYNLTEKHYDYTVGGTLPSNPFIKETLAKIPELTLEKPIQLAATGKGTLKPLTHNGELIIPETVFNHTETGITTFSAYVKSDWPGGFTAPFIEVENSFGSIKAALSWEDELVSIHTLSVQDTRGTLLDINGQLPLTQTTHSIQDLLQNNRPIELSITANECSLKRLRNILPIPDNPLSGRINGQFTVGGTYSKPELNGAITGSNWVIETVDGLRPLDFTLTTKTEKQSLTLNGSLQEGKENLAVINGTLPLAITAWLNKEKSFNATPVDLTLKASRVQLQRFRKAVPTLNRMEGDLDVDLTLSGTVARPTIFGKAVTNIDRLRFENESIPDLRNSQVNISFKERLILIEPSRLTGSGGKFDLSGSIDLENDAPVFDISFLADKALLYRDDAVNVRADARLRLSGTLDNALVTGEIALAETLYYKDIELIPFGVPASSVPSPTSPRVSSPPSDTTLPVPSPYSNWRLDVDFRTKDPILIRGNLAKGQVNGVGSIRGTVATPSITLDARLDDVIAELPLSQLTVNRGEITLRPGDGFIPKLNIRGVSKVGDYQVNVFVQGKADETKIIFNSNPPLPESEILTLLATGTTSKALEDGQVASMKAFQLLINELHRKMQRERPESLATGALETLKKIDLKVGENDPFSGRRFNSVTLKLSSKYYASAAFDQEGNSRGILIYALRF